MLKLFNRITFAAYTAFLFLILAPSALADSVSPQPGLAISSKQVWVLLIGSLVPLVTYVVNHVGPWVSEPAKAVVTVLAAAVAGGLYTALATSSFGWNSATAEMVATAVIAALGAHHWLWKPATISVRLGGGSNASGGGHHLVWQKDEPTPSVPAPAPESSAKQ